MWLGGKLFENIKKFIRHEQPDILALQEVHHAEYAPTEKEWHTVQKLTNILGYTHYAYAPSMAKNQEGGKKIQYGNAVLSRVPIRSTRSIFYDVPYNGAYEDIPNDYRFTPRNLQHAELDAGSTMLHLFNTQGIWGFDGKDNPRRLNMGKIIAKEIAGKIPAILAGDMNVQENSKTIKKIERHMSNVFKGELKTSFNLRRKPADKFSEAVVDMIFASPEIKIGRHYTTHDNVSDHLALVAEIEIP
jgi:endonuclease/exonuclease/phosphatase family metal-dependent hydrolase